jgi:hypothetical protein
LNDEQFLDECILDNFGTLSVHFPLIFSLILINRG